MIALVLGAAEFGNVLYNANMIQTGVRDAARYLARTPDPQLDEQRGRNLATRGAISGNAPQRVSWWRSEDVVVDFRLIPNVTQDVTGTSRYRGGDFIGVVRVSTSVEYPGLGTLALIGRDSMRLSFAHEERWVGQ